MAYLVSVVVTFVLIPGGKQQGLPTANFFKVLPLLMHNANVVFMALELVLNRIPFCAMHFPFVLIYGSAYVIFSW